MARAKSDSATETLLRDMQEAGLGSMSWAAEVWSEGARHFGHEMMSFLSDRLQKDLETQSKIMQCREIGELQKVQMEFLSEAISDYTEQTGKMIRESQDFLARLTKTAEDGK